MTGRDGAESDGAMRHRFAVEAVVAGVALAVTLGLLAARGLGTPEPHARALDALGVLLAVASTLPLVLRWRAPATVYLVSAAASVALLHFGYPLDAPIAPLFATYALSVRYGGHPRVSWRIGAMALAVGFVPGVAAGYATAGVDVAAILAELLAWGGVVTGIWIAGDRTRLRGERMAALEERARQAEREAERERRLAAAEERTRIARELHDSAGHAINVILVQAGAARLLHDRRPAESLAAIAIVEDVATELIGEIDRLVRALRHDDAGDPDDAGPAEPAAPAAVHDLVERHRAGGLRVAGDVTEPAGTPPRSVALAAYRILQEALTNAARHGGGSAHLEYRCGRDAVEITVTNPTRSAAPGNSAGHGIVGMQERAALLGGTIEAGPVGPAFRVHARLPYDEPAAWQRTAS